MSDTTDKTPGTDPLARIASSRNGAEPEPVEPDATEPEHAGDTPVEPIEGEDRVRFQRQIYDGLLDLAPDDVLASPVPPDLRAIPVSAEVVRQVRADVKNAGYRLKELTKQVNRDQMLNMAQYAILWAMIVLVSRRVEKIVNVVRELDPRGIS